MKIQIDFTLKTIKLESNVNLGKFVETMQEMFSDWKEYKILTNTKIEWVSYPTYYPPNNPWIHRGNIYNKLSLPGDYTNSTTYTGSRSISSLSTNNQLGNTETSNIVNLEI